MARPADPRRTVLDENSAASLTRLHQCLRAGRQEASRHPPCRAAPPGGLRRVGRWQCARARRYGARQCVDIRNVAAGAAALDHRLLNQTVLDQPGSGTVREFPAVIE